MTRLSTQQKSMLDTALPEMTSRSVWTQQDVKSHSLVVLGFSRLTLVPIGAAITPGTMDAIRKGVELASVFGPMAETIELASIRKVIVDLRSDTITFESVSEGFGSQKVSIVFANAERADEAFTKLWKRFGEDAFTLKPHKLEGWSAIQVPFFCMLGVAVATLFIALFLSTIEDLALAQASSPYLPDGSLRPAPWWWPLISLSEAVNWRWICGLGGCILACLQIWMYRRYTDPPARLELYRK